MPSARPFHLMLFTDSLGDVNGVSRFVRNIAREAAETGRRLTVVSCTRFDVPGADNIVNFPPRAAWKMPGYANLEIVLPPAGAMMRLARGARPDAVHVSTPGPVGMVGRRAAAALGVPLAGVYHTDFPAYIEHLFDDPVLTHGCAAAMRWFYRPLAAIFVRSGVYIEALARLGIERRVVRLRPGIRTQDFHPRFRAGSRAGVRVLYVGRVSVEKNMPLLVRAWARADAALRERGVEAELAVVGDGPYRREMEAALAGTRTSFHGFRHGEELSRLYASGDVFVFPSTTDTLGQVVMEAQASGLPTIVTDQGGPRELVEDGVTGLVVNAHADAWARAIVDLAGNDGWRCAMGVAAAARMEAYSIRACFEEFWGAHEGLCATEFG